MIPVLIVCLGFLMFSSAAFATEYYVAPTGNDNNPGTINSPFKTISKGVSRLKAGDILYVGTGTYVETVYVGQSGTSNSPITIMAYPGDSPVIDGQDKLPASNWTSLMLLEGDYIYVSGFEVKNSNITGKYLGGAGVTLAGQHNKASKMNVHHIWEIGIHASGNYSVVEDCRVWQCAFANSINPGSPATGYWATGVSAARSQIDGITRNAILRRNIVYNNWGEGLSSFEADGTLIEDNIVYDNWSVNLYISDTRNALVQRNIVYNTPNNVVRQRRPFTLGDERADKPRSANNIVINNLIYNADLWAFWSTGVPYSGLDNVLIAYNTIVNGQLEIGANIGDRVINKSALITNNIFLNENGSPWDIKGSLANLTFSHNLWSALPPKSLTGAGDVVGDPRLAKTGSTGPGELTADYFKLLITSPAIDNGAFINNVTEDFFGNPRGAVPDIGAHENSTPVTNIDIIDPHDPESILITVNQSILTILLQKNEAYKNISLYNLLGVLVLKQDFTDNMYSTDVSFLIPGIYIIVLSGDIEQHQLKMIII